MKTLLLIFFLVFYYSAKAQNDPELFPVNDRKAGYIGYNLEDGTNVVKPQFCSATYSIDGYYVVSKGEHEYDEYKNRKEEHIPNTEKFALLNSKGNFIIDFKNNYEFIGIANGIIQVKRNNLYGVINGKNEIVIPLEYDEIFSFTENKQANSFYMIVSMGNKKGVIDNYNQFIVGLSKIDLQFVTEKSICIKKGKKFSLTNHNLKPILPNDFDVMYLVDIARNEIYAENKGYGYYFTVDGKILKKEKLEYTKEYQK